MKVQQRKSDSTRRKRTCRNLHCHLHAVPLSVGQSGARVPAMQKGNATVHGHHLPILVSSRCEKNRHDLVTYTPNGSDIHLHLFGEKALHFCLQPRLFRLRSSTKWDLSSLEGISSTLSLTITLIAYRKFTAYDPNVQVSVRLQQFRSRFLIVKGTSWAR
jgi:hypothetical protein